MAPSATLYRMVTDDHVCPYGIKARHLLRSRGFSLDDEPLESRAETDAFKEKAGVETTPQVYIEGERIGGYDALREHLGLEGSETTYAPIVAVFATTFLLALAATYAAGASFLDMGVIERFVAYSMAVLAVLKLRDLEAFSLQFVGYDLLARRWVPWSYVYPFVELLAGVAMIAGVVPWLSGPAAMLIGTIGGVSVVKAVYIDGRELKCACVGGDSNVPLGAISLTENVMMVALGAWTLGSFLW